MYGGWRQWDQKPDAWVDTEYERNAHETSLSRMLQSVATYELVREHEERTFICSVQHHMRKCSGPVYQELKRRYHASDDGEKEDMLTDILAYLADEDAGMNVMMLLWDFTCVDPTEDAQEDVGAGFVGYRVEDCRRLWLEWGKRRGLWESWW